ncbi:TetR/AcrR family transcriptional regulator [Desulforhopalus sp. 52FAK]
MAKKKFEIEHVINTAIALFWRQGYAATSIQAIVKETGVQPGSIYHEFGSKEALFKLALTHYAQKTIEDVSRKVNASNDVLEGIRKLLLGLIEASGREDYCGCFLIKSQLELASQNNEIYTYVIESLGEIEEHYASYLNQIYPAATASLYASQLMMVIFGLRVYGYRKGSRETLAKATESLLPWLFGPA